MAQSCTCRPASQPASQSASPVPPQCKARSSSSGRVAAARATRCRDNSVTLLANAHSFHYTVNTVSLNTQPGHCPDVPPGAANRQQRHLAACYVSCIVSQRPYCPRLHYIVGTRHASLTWSSAIRQQSPCAVALKARDPIQLQREWFPAQPGYGGQAE